MEERQIALAPALYKELLNAVYNHNLPINIQVHKNEGKLKQLTLSHVDAFEKELEEAGITTEVASPKLLPDYRRKAN